MKILEEHVFDMYAKVLRRLEAAAGHAQEHKCCAPIILMARHICFALICARTFEFVMWACILGIPFDCARTYQTRMYTRVDDRVDDREGFLR